MAHYQPLPPHIHHTTTRLTHRTAHTMLSTFLALAENNPAYRPDSTLTERGPISSSSAASANLTLAHLQRVLEGMEGKRVGGGNELDGGFTDAGVGEARRKRRYDDVFDEDAASQTSQTKRRRPSMNVQTDSRNGVFILPEQSEPEMDTPGGEWQDKEDFDTHRVDDEVGIMNEDRLPGANLEQPRNEEEAAEMVGVAIEGSGRKVDPRPGATDEIGGGGGVEGLSKEERKRRKKERRKEEARRKGTAKQS